MNHDYIRRSTKRLISRARAVQCAGYSRLVPRRSTQAVRVIATRTFATSFGFLPGFTTNSRVTRYTQHGLNLFSPGMQCFCLALYLVKCLKHVLAGARQALQLVYSFLASQILCSIDLFVSRQQPYRNAWASMRRRYYCLRISGVYFHSIPSSLYAPHPWSSACFLNSRQPRSALRTKWIGIS